jgi:hypothetical protein
VRKGKRGPGRVEEDVAEELRHDFELRSRELEAEGMDGASARREAERRFGNIRRIEEQSGSRKPGPVSHKVTVTEPAARSTSMPMLPARSVAWAALSSRPRKSCSRAAALPVTHRFESGRTSWNAGVRSRSMIAVAMLGLPFVLSTPLRNPR